MTSSIEGYVGVKTLEVRGSTYMNNFYLIKGVQKSTDTTYSPVLYIHTQYSVELAIEERCVYMLLRYAQTIGFPRIELKHS